MKLQAATTAGETVQVEALTNLICAACAADALQPCKVKKLSWAGMQKFVGILEKYGEVIPPSIARSVTRRHAEHLLAQEKFSDWALCALPWRQDVDEHNAPLTLVAPRMGCLMGVSPEDIADTSENFLASLSMTPAARCC